MRELASSFVQLTVIVALMVMLAVSTAAVAQWASGDLTTGAGVSTSQTPSMLAADTVR
ncbi:MAG TPA: hypothetical protein VNA19_07125 [Pyrinomonadaceae bacterium]|jgi:hypothetical protein|nr:hypothetical protein [Pyrinomonadaceae bacterium]